MKTKLWIIATPISKANKGNKINNGTNEIKSRSPVQANRFQANPTITFNSVWPAIMFAKSRIDKLIGLKTYDNSSIGTNNNDNTTDAPDGKNNEKNLHPCMKIQKIVTLKNKKELKVSVTMKWLVNVKV